MPVDTLSLKNAIVRAAIEWERAKHEKVPAYGDRELREQENALASAVQAYALAIVEADAPAVVKGDIPF